MIFYIILVLLILYIFASAIYYRWKDYKETKFLDRKFELIIEDAKRAKDMIKTIRRRSG